MRLTRHLDDEADTLALGAALAPALTPGMVIYLYGDLGAGKTTLVRGVLRGRGYSGRVKSPTYTLVELYEVSRLYLYHFDFYRLDQATEWIDAGFREHFSGDAVCLVEWPERAAGTLPQADLEVRLSIAAAGRDAELLATSELGRCLLATIIPPRGNKVT